MTHLSIAIRCALIAFAMSFAAACPKSPDASNLSAKSEAEPVIRNQVNLVILTGKNEILWNGTPVSQEQLSQLLAETVRMPVEPQLRFEPEMEASYELSAAVLKIMKEAGVTKFGFVGNEKYPPPEQTRD